MTPLIIICRHLIPREEASHWQEDKGHPDVGQPHGIRP